MRTVKFNDISYSLVDHENIISLYFQATILKGDYTVDEIVEDALSAEEIKVYENDEQVAIYRGYDRLNAASMYDVSDGRVVSLELLNADYEQRLNDLSSVVSDMQQIQNEHSEAIEELTPYVDSATAYFNESEKTFYNVPEGNISVFFDNYNGSYSVSRVSDRVTVSFDTLTQSTSITISVS